MSQKNEFTNQPLVSVIVPVYNVEDWLRECLDSIIPQLQGRLEMILIDDGSTDTSGQIADDYALQYDFVRVYHTANGGLSRARNLGASYATGEYITFVDSDDLLTENALQLLYNKAQETGAEVVVGDARRYSTARGIWKSGLIRRSTEHLPEDTDVTSFSDAPYLNFNLTAWDILIRREFYLANHIAFPEGFLYEDEPTITSLYLAAEKIGLVREVVYLWRVREDESKPSITQTAKSRQITHDRCLLLDRVRREYEEKLGLDRPEYSQLRLIRIYKWLDQDMNVLIRNLDPGDDELSNYIIETTGDFVRSFMHWPEFNAGLLMCRPMNILKIKALVADNRERLFILTAYTKGDYRRLRAIQSAEVRLYRKLHGFCKGRKVNLIATGETERNLRLYNGMGIWDKEIELVMTARKFRMLMADEEFRETFHPQLVRRGMFGKQMVIGFPEDAEEYQLELDGQRPQIRITPVSGMPRMNETNYVNENFEYTKLYRPR